MKKRISFAELKLLCKLNGKNPADWRVAPQRRQVWYYLNEEEASIINNIRDGGSYGSHNLTVEGVDERKGIKCNINGEEIVLTNVSPSITQSKLAKSTVDRKKEAYIAELEAIIKTRENCSAEVYQIQPTSNPNSGKSISTVIALLSDVHGDEIVKPETVMGLNEYNPTVCKARLEGYFLNLVKLISHAQKNYNINEVILGMLGDFIGGWIHEELQQTNSLSPLSAVAYIQGILVSGLKYLNDNLDVDKITVIGVVGNHGRLTKKNQYANATDVNLEYFMYKTIESTCNELGLKKLQFIIPQAEAAIIEVFGKRLFFTHGTNIKYGGGIGGIIVPVSRWFANTSKAFKIDFAFIGHFHQSLFTKKFCINGSVKGIDAYAVGKMLDLEEAQQAMIIFNEKRGFTQYSPIFF